MGMWIPWVFTCCLRNIVFRCYYLSLMPQVTLRCIEYWAFKLDICLPTCQSVSPSVRPSVRLSILSSARPSVSQPASQSVSQMVSPFPVSPKNSLLRCFMLSKVYSVIVYLMPCGNPMPGKSLAEIQLLPVKLHYSFIWNISRRKRWIIIIS